MNRLRPHGLVALMAVPALASVLLATGCSAATLGGSPVLAANNSADRAGTARPGAPADSGFAGCTALLGARQAAHPDYPKIRSQFAGSRWPDLRAAGTSYMDLAIKLRRPQYTDGYETVSRYQRLAVACARHGWESKRRQVTTPSRHHAGSTKPEA